MGIDWNVINWNIYVWIFLCYVVVLVSVSVRCCSVNVFMLCMMLVD